MSKKIKYTDEPMAMGERVKDFLPPPSQLVLRKSGTKQKPKLKQQVTDDTGTNWNKLHRKSAAEIRAGVEADPDAHPTDANFWKGAKVVRQPLFTGR
jgi:hypothetical protein